MARRGRPAHNRKQGKRTKTGILSREQEQKAIMRALEGKKYEAAEKETLMNNLEARVTKHGIDPKKAMDQRAGSFVGRLCLGGEISKAQLAAAEQWMEERHAYQFAIDCPPGDQAIDLTRAPGRTHGEDVARTQKAVERFEASKKALREAQDAIGLRSNLYAAMNLLVEREQELHHLVGDLREALNALARHYRITGRRAA
ncbi:hypothetical protein [Pelagibacterium sediminicola]|uniref:hypothetical protein n=1 Tax=Pelagibacterium sediminicola TaxID=2248761 RepID=UPI000E320808|nr:hypothetical protein [Pelagibacterium sediminicola]